MSLENITSNINNLDTGVPDELSCIYDLKSNQFDNIPEKHIKNPFFIGIEEKEQYDITDFYKTFKRVLVMCRKNNSSGNDTLFKLYVTKEELQSLDKDYTFLLTDTKILKNKNHIKYLIVLENHYLSLFDCLQINYESTEAVIILGNISEDKARHYCHLYSGIYTTKYIMDTLYLTNRYKSPNIQYVEHMQNKLSQMFQRFDDSDYWTNSFNCKINHTKMFKQRIFGLHQNNINRKHIASTSNLNSIIKINTKNDGYENMNLTENKHLPEIQSKKKYIDVSSSLKYKKYKLYTIDNTPLEISKDQINALFKMTDSHRLRYNMFNSLLLSKKYCHIVLNNPYILDMMQPTIEKAMPFYRYIFGYAWLYMYLEECIQKTRITHDSRIVFSINTVNKLPFFPHSIENLRSSPYLPLLVDNKEIDIEKNCLSIPILKDYKFYGIDTLEGFRKKFNIFTTGTADKNIFDGIDWKVYAIGGSIVQACALKKSPITELFKRNNDLETFNYYYNMIYGSSDIDVMSCAKNIYQFMSDFDKLVQQIAINLGRTVSDLKINPVRKAIITVHYDYIKNILNDDVDPEEIKNNINKSEIRERFYEVYTIHKFKKNRMMRKKHKSNASQYYYKPIDMDDLTINISFEKVMRDKTEENTIINRNDIVNDRKENYTVLSITESLRLQVSSPLMNHDFEVFRASFGNPLSTVTRFHLPCVRNYYKGDTSPEANDSDVYLVPSSIFALMSGINIQCRYFASIRDPSVILNKYRMYGHGIILNKQEQHYYNNYCNDNKIKFLTNKHTNKEHYNLGYITLDSELFPKDPEINVSNKSYILKDYDLYEYYKRNYGYDEHESEINFMKLTTINSDGTINPFKKWTLDAAYDNFFIN